MTIRDLSALIKTAKGHLTSDPQSGGILKVLQETPGFAEKIGNGAETGHTYRVLHAPGERNFVLLDRWTEKDGRVRTMYHPFVIADQDKIQDTSTKNQTPHPNPLPEGEGAASLASSDVFSKMLDGLEQSLDEFLSFAKA